MASYKKPAVAKGNCDSIQLFRERLSEKVHTTIPKGIVGRFWVHSSWKKFERMVREAMDYVSEC